MPAPDFDGTQPCAGVDPEVFFPPTAEGEREAAKSVAGTVCGQCPFRPECLEFAISSREVGVWAGTTTRERAAMARKRGGPRVTSQMVERAERLAVIADLHRKGLDSDTIRARTGYAVWQVARALREIRELDAEQVGVMTQPQQLLVERAAREVEEQAAARSASRPSTSRRSTSSRPSLPTRSSSTRRRGAGAPAPPNRPPGAVPLTRAGSGQTCKRPASTTKPSGATHTEGIIP